jgi:hypothetical protein
LLADAEERSIEIVASYRIEPALQAEVGYCPWSDKLSTKYTIVFREEGRNLKVRTFGNYAKNITVQWKSCSVSQNWNHIRSGEQTRVQRGERRKKNSVLCAACLRPAEQSGELCPAQRPALLAALFVAGKQLVPANQTASETSKSERKPNKYCGHVCDVSLEDQMVKIA